jgi:hypothetical protein
LLLLVDYLSFELILNQFLLHWFKNWTMNQLTYHNIHRAHQTWMSFDECSTIHQQWIPPNPFMAWMGLAGTFHFIFYKNVYRCITYIYFFQKNKGVKNIQKIGYKNILILLHYYILYLLEFGTWPL